MKIYYMVDVELGWDNVCAMGKTLKEMAQDYYEEDLSKLTDQEIYQKIDDDELRWESRTIKD